MKNITINNILKICNGKLIGPLNGNADVEADGVVIDSRLARENYIFIATVGERADGHTFIDNVFENGALAVICEKQPQCPAGPCILVEDSLEALRRIAEFYRKQIPAKIIGITGSVGKTSTKEFVAGVLSKSFNVYKTEGNFNNTIGVPLTILKIRDEHEIAVVEMGINHFGEMSMLTSIVRPDIAIITNIGECHLEFLIDRDGVLKAKSEIFEGLQIDGSVILNGDDDKLLTINEVHDKKPLYTGINNKSADYIALNIKDSGIYGSSFDVRLPNGTTFNTTVSLPGMHMVSNALTATAVAHSLNMDIDSIRQGIQAIKPTEGRSNIINVNDLIIIDDCYNANPTSTKAALDMLSKTEVKGNKIAILGDMFELGNNEDSLHREIGAYAAGKGIDKIICIGRLSYNTYIGVRDCCTEKTDSNVFYYETLESAMNSISDHIAGGDIVLIKASHGMNFKTLVDYFSVQQNP